MQETDRTNTNQKWRAWKTAGTVVLLVAAVIATFVLPFVFLGLADDALDRHDMAGAARWEEWSYGVIALGPSLFLTSFLAIASQFLPVERWLIRVLAFVLSGGILWGIYATSPKIHLTVLLSLVGVVYSVVADICAPNSSGKAKSADDSADGGGPEEAASKAEATRASVVSASLEPRV
ncbi:hypothetical protein [Paenarthrobacter sp. PH39-S1]|uniref:hypothetical protein n=1 Tax=Paenarthrobacter sp. PH39-S1 TaxID=3046204 RepID=UPI0024B904C0|nr:hypothetical protein [Paenarthrobacter sp. PH39-S1]MDJ0356049.1 hypothetical protein [Paenarthrobacter sp. PH39-S1]